MGTVLTGLLQLRVGDVWTPATGALTNTGRNGEWLYVATQPETNKETNEIELRIVHPTWYAQTLVHLKSGTPSGAGLLLFNTPTGDLSDNEDLARWIPVVMTINVPVGMSIVIVVTQQDEEETPSVLTHTAYADELGGFQPMWEDKSTVSVDGDDVTISLLPNGGWTRPNISITPYVAFECDIASGSGGGAGSLISYSVQGQLAITPDTARRTPIAVNYSTPAGYSLLVIAMMGTNTFFPVVVYADELAGLQALFAPGENSLGNVVSPASTVDITGTIPGGRTISASWIPVGGWIRENVQLLSYIALEATA